MVGFASFPSRILRFLLPWACASCRAALLHPKDEGFCGRCWLAIPRIDGLICQACGLPIPDGGALCYPCRREAPNFLIRAAARYSGALPPAIWRFKYAGRKSLAHPFATLMAGALDRFPELHPVHGFVPVPLHPAAEKERGYNQAAELARALGEITGRPVLDGLLVRVRRTTPSLRLTRKERQINLENAFGWGISSDQTKRLRGISLLLVDDVCTTTSTLRGCAAVLKTAGAGKVAALVIARD